MHQPTTNRRTHQRRACLLAACIFVAIMLGAGGLSAQQVLLAPQITLTFDDIAVTGRPQAIRITHTLDRGDWKWAQDMGLDLWLAAYRRDEGQSWRLQRVEPLSQAEGTLSFTNQIEADAREFGLCVIAASYGGRLAPGMGYVCNTPLVVPVRGSALDWQKADADVVLRFERRIDAQPFYTATLGFEKAARPEPAVEKSAHFIVYRGPSPPEPVSTDTTRAQQQRSRDQHDQEKRAHHRHRCPTYSPCGYAYESIGGFSERFERFDRFGRFGADIFRRRRFLAGQFFGPFDSFDARSNEDMFSTHPDDVFFNFPVTPGRFGRDAFGRDLVGTFGDRFDGAMFRSHPGDVFFNRRVPPGLFGGDGVGRDVQPGFGAPANARPMPGSPKGGGHVQEP